MGQITFGGLASGLDTDGIITALMDVERQPLTRMENEKSYLKGELDAYSEFNGKLDSLNNAIKELDAFNEISSYAASSSNGQLLSASASSDATPGSYSIEVISLSAVQKDASAEGFADVDSPTLSGSLAIGTTNINYADISLKDLATMINDTDSGVSASIINDGTTDGYRLILSGDQGGVETKILGTGSINIDTTSNGHTRDSSLAHIIIDNIDIYSTNNTITDAIPGVTLDLSDASTPGETLSVKVATNTNAIEQKINNFVSSYNGIITYLDQQKDADWGNDSGFSSTKRKMQSLLTTQIETGSNLTSLTMIGFKTDYKTGSISVDNSSLSKAIEDDFEGLTALFIGPNGDDGIANTFSDYLDTRTGSTNGLYALKQESYDSSIRRIDKSISALERRLVKREANLRSEYAALELLMSEMNSQTSYLDSINNLSSN